MRSRFALVLVTLVALSHATHACQRFRTTDPVFEKALLAVQVLPEYDAWSASARRHGEVVVQREDQFGQQTDIDGECFTPVTLASGAPNGGWSTDRYWHTFLVGGVPGQVFVLGEGNRPIDLESWRRGLARVDAVWQGVLQLFDGPPGDGALPSVKDIERIIGFAFTTEEAETSPPTIGAPFFYSARSQAPGLGHYQKGLFQWPNESSFSISWDSGLECVRLDDAVAQLKRRGWIPAGQRPSWPTASNWEFVHKAAGRSDTLAYLWMANSASTCVLGASIDFSRQAGGPGGGASSRAPNTSS